MGIGNVSSYASTYGTTQVNNEVNANQAAQAGDAKSGQVADGVVYEKNTPQEKKASYSINKMSKEDRDALIQQLKADQASREQSLMSLVNQMFSKQANTYGQANNIWQFIASGNYTVDAATKAQAQEDISEDGYWGVKQTSQRLFDFASALAGDDVDKMKEMQAAIEKGYKLATKDWGRDLPSISKDTFDATNKLFDEYYKAKESGLA